jgi:Ca2+-binding EF-hand superfamily protein
VPPLPVELAKLHKSGIGKRADINRVEFVNAILKSIPSRLRKKESDPPLPPTPEETLGNFFLSFDLDQLDRVPINQLMGGLALLCGGKKSHKLSFAFSLFDMRKEEQKKSRKRKLDDVTSLSGKELFFFFQSFLIVMFSCCKQSLDLTAETVSRYIADTANMVTDDVMKFQWATRKMDRINFDEFGEWYNEGGFEIAPWLELLDLNKWVLLDKAKVEKLLADAKPMEAKRKSYLKDSSHRQNLPLPGPTPSKSNIMGETFDVLPPTPADHLLDPTSYEFFGDDIDIDAIDDFGFDFNDCGTNQVVNVNDLPPPSTSKYNLPIHEQKPLNFKVVANESTFYNVSIPSNRVEMLERIVDHQLFSINTDTLCQAIISEKVGTSISKDKYMDIVKKLFKPNTSSHGKLLMKLLSTIFHEFDFDKCGKADAVELACGMTVLCGGRKSDKIEYAFEFLDKKKNGRVSRFAMVRYLRAFLAVLLHINSCELGDNPVERILFDASGHPVDNSVSIERITEAVSSWVTDQVFKCTPKEKRTAEGGTEFINFDNFAEWYTGGGYNNADWLELLDLKKWIKFST